MFTAVTGTGGGLILLGLLPGFVSPAALIPVHAVVQLASNSSRALFAWRNIAWQYIGAFVLGSIVGSLVSSQFVRLLNFDYITLIVAAFILLNVWLPDWAGKLIDGRGEMFGIGAIQTGLGTVGANTGPLANASLMRRGCSHDEVVTTAAVQMSVTHLIKILAFASLGVTIGQWWQLILGMSVGVILGSWVGTRSRTTMESELLEKIVKILLTLLALRMVVLTIE